MPVHELSSVLRTDTAETTDCETLRALASNETSQGSLGIYLLAVSVMISSTKGVSICEKEILGDTTAFADGLPYTVTV